MPGAPPSGAVGPMPGEGSREGGRPLTVLRSAAASRTGIALGVLVLVSAAVRGYWTTWIPTPWINGDEVIYTLLGRSLWHSGHLSILGAPTRFYSAVTPALIGGFLSLHKVALGYSLAKWLQAIVMSLGAVPVYLWGRRLVSPGWALVAAALTLALPGLAYSGLLMTEVAFFPILLLVAWTMALALEKPSLANQLWLTAAIALAVATRLQALVLVLAYPTALALKLVFDRGAVRSLRSYAPSLLGLVALAGAWSTWQLASGEGVGTDVLGAYRAAGETSYSVSAALKFVVYHVADVVLLTGVIPACAVVLLLPRARELPAAGRAYLATTLALTGWFVLEVGIFASRLVGTLAERNLFPLAPLFFLGLVVWLKHGAERPLRATAAIAVAVVALVALVPPAALTVDAIRWESFTLISFYDIHTWVPGANLRPLLVVSIVPLLALFVLVPRKQLWLLPAGLLVLFATLSGIATETSIAQSRSESQLVGKRKSWVNINASGRPTVFLTGGEALWPAVYENIFWNDAITRVDTLPGFAVPGPLPQTPVGPETDGTIVDARGRPVSARYVVASNTLTLFGEKLAAPRRTKLVLWHVQPPFRLSTWLTGLSIVTTSIDPRGDLSVAGGMGSDAKLVVYACSGSFKLKLVAHGVPTSIQIRTNGSLARRAQLQPWHAVETTVPAVPSRQTGNSSTTPACQLDVHSSAGLDARLELHRSR
jgi:hypothetical protein